MKRTHNTHQPSRTGVSAILIVAMLFVFIVSAALTVDISYMQLVRTELRAATDAAAKAGAEALARTEDETEAIRAAQEYAELNNVGGQPFRIGTNDVKFGRVVPNPNGKYEFSENATPANAVSIVGKVGDGARTGPIPLFFAKSLGHKDFSTSHSATASQQDVEVCLALDRSGSMLFDMTGRDWAYPRNNPRLSTWWQWGTLWRNNLSPPNPVGSRWANLSNAIDVFLAEAGSYDQPPRVGLVSWGLTTRCRFHRARFSKARLLTLLFPTRIQTIGTTTLVRLHAPFQTCRLFR